MGNHLGKREREARKRNKKRTVARYSTGGMSGWLTLKLGARKWSKINFNTLKLPF